MSPPTVCRAASHTPRRWTTPCCDTATAARRAPLAASGRSEARRGCLRGRAQSGDRSEHTVSTFDFGHFFLSLAARARSDWWKMLCMYAPPGALTASYARPLIGACGRAVQRCVHDGINRNSNARPRSRLGRRNRGARHENMRLGDRLVKPKATSTFQMTIPHNPHADRSNVYSVLVARSGRVWRGANMILPSCMCRISSDARTRATTTTRERGGAMPRSHRLMWRP